jgi:hypothetical protein
MSEPIQPANNFAGFHVRQVPMTPEEEAKAKGMDLAEWKKIKNELTLKERSFEAMGGEIRFQERVCDLRIEESASGRRDR